MSSEEKQQMKSSEKVDNSSLWIVSAVFVALLAFLKGYSLVGGFDIWWHLKTGQFRSQFCDFQAHFYLELRELMLNGTSSAVRFTEGMERRCLERARLGRHGTSV